MLIQNNIILITIIFSLISIVIIITMIIIIIIILITILFLLLLLIINIIITIIISIVIYRRTEKAAARCLNASVSGPPPAMSNSCMYLLLYLSLSSLLLS